MAENNYSRVEIYSDGSSSGNPGRGGYGAIVRYFSSAGLVKTDELSQGYRETTNNRMELLGAIVAFESVNVKVPIDFYSDSQYVVNSFSKGWIYSWQKKGWRNSKGDAVKNPDLWKRALVAISGRSISWHWVRGHAGHKFNEKCDALATAATASNATAIDEWYENNVSSAKPSKKSHANSHQANSHHANNSQKATNSQEATNSQNAANSQETTNPETGESTQNAPKENSPTLFDLIGFDEF